MKILFTDSEKDLTIRAVVGMAKMMASLRRESSKNLPGLSTRDIKRYAIKILKKLKTTTGLSDLKPLERAFICKALMYLREALVQADTEVEGFISRKFTKRKKIEGIQNTIKLVDQTILKLAAEPK